MAAVAEGVAHRCNNLLSSVLTHVESLRETLRKPEAFAHHQTHELGTNSRELRPEQSELASVSDALDGIDAAVRSTARVTRDLLFSIGQGTQPNGPIALIELLHEAAADAAAPQISFEVAELTPSDAGPATVRGDRAALAGVVGQLVANACEACGAHGGRVLLRAGRTTLDDLEGLQHEQAAFFEILDQGHGMTPETTARMFDPFFSTKFKGRGLGLAATLGIVASHRGMIHVDSRPQLGTRIRVTLPTDPERMSAAVPRATGPARSPIGSGERLRILIAEDDAPLRNAFVRILQREGHEVLAAEDGEAAWALYTAHRGAFDLLIADQTMPRLEGVDLVARVREKSSDLPVILVSAVVGSELRARGAALAVTHVLSKPLFPRELFKAIAELTAPGPLAAHG
jgi:CheY-like chemotaxis protein